jgi:hypothetical protein
MRALTGQPEPQAEDDPPEPPVASFDGGARAIRDWPTTAPMTHGEFLGQVIHQSRGADSTARRVMNKFRFVHSKSVEITGEVEMGHAMRADSARYAAPRRGLRPIRRAGEIGPALLRPTGRAVPGRTFGQRRGRSIRSESQTGRMTDDPIRDLLAGVARHTMDLRPEYLAAPVGHVEAHIAEPASPFQGDIEAVRAWVEARNGWLENPPVPKSGGLRPGRHVEPRVVGEPRPFRHAPGGVGPRTVERA